MVAMFLTSVDIIPSYFAKSSFHISGIIVLSPLLVQRKLLQRLRGSNWCAIRVENTYVEDVETSLQYRYVPHLQVGHPSRIIRIPLEYNRGCCNPLRYLIAHLPK